MNAREEGAAVSEALATWNRLAAEYDEMYAQKAPGPHYQLPDDSLWLLAARLPEAASVLDWGCGPGRHSLALAQEGHTVTALDVSAEGLAYLERFARQLDCAARITTHRAGELAGLGEATYDGVLMTSLLHHFDAATAHGMLAEAAGRLRPGGHLWLVTYVDFCGQLTEASGFIPTATEPVMSMLEAVGLRVVARSWEHEMYGNCCSLIAQRS